MGRSLFRLMLSLAGLKMRGRGRLDPSGAALLLGYLIVEIDCFLLCLSGAQRSSDGQILTHILAASRFKHSHAKSVAGLAVVECARRTTSGMSVVAAGGVARRSI